MDLQSLEAIIGEAAPLLTGARVNRVYESETGDIIMLFRNKGRDSVLLLSPDRSLPRLHLLSRKPQARPSLHAFTLYLRSRIAGGRIEAVALLNRDRIVEMQFECRGAHIRLLAELFGTSANLVLTDPDGIILKLYYSGAASHVGSRPLMPGIRYAPPDRKGLLPAGASRNSIVIPVEHAGSPNRQSEIFFQQVLARRAIETARANLLSSVRKACRRTERKLEALANDRHHADQAEEYRCCGDLILANLPHLHPGMKETELEGPDGRKISIVLDPRRSPSANAERYFKRYKKAKSGRIVIEKRTGEVRDELSFLRSLADELETAAGESDLSMLQEKLQQSGLLRAVQARGSRRPETLYDPFRRIPYRGWEILVGRNAQGNDYLTTRIARDSDLWLHAEGMSGSHVVVRNPHGRDIPRDVLERAASLAAHYSKGRGSGKVPVTYTFARSVRKPKGAKPGLVALTERKTMMSVPQGEQNDDE